MFCNCLKNPSESFDIFKYVSFGTSSTRSGSRKLRHKGSNSNSQRHFYFHRLIRLWNFLPIVDLSLSAPVIKSKLKSYFWSVFVSKFDSLNICTFHLLCPCNNCLSTPSLPNFNFLQLFSLCIYSALLFLFVFVFLFFVFFVVLFWLPG